MRIALLANDTRGGIEPYVHLAVGLRDAGHEVRFIAPADFAPMVEKSGLPFVPLTGGVEAAVRGSGGTASEGSVASTRFAMRELPKILRTWMQEALAACEGVEVIAGGIGGMVMGLPVSEKLGVPFQELHLQPVGAPTDAYPGVLFAGAPRFLWRLSHRLTEAALWMPFRGTMAKARQAALGLSGPMKAQGDGAVLYGFSRHVVPMPQEGPRARVLTGYWTSRDEVQPPEALARFLEQKGPVVSIGFGSMPTRDPAAHAELIAGAVRDAGVRAVLVSGWGGLGPRDASDDVLQVDSVPYRWLFPRVAGVVHHGGAGTTGAALTAGVPSLVAPFMMDQPFWGSRVAALGAGPSPIPQKQLTRARLARALTVMVSDTVMQAKARALGELLRAEDGLAAAVAHFGGLQRPQ